MDLVGKLRGYFKNRKEVEVAYLFGSHATGSVSSLSDVDIAVVFNESLSKTERFKTTLNLIGDLTSLSDSDRVDVVDLDEARLLLKYNIIKDGVPVKTSSVRAQVEFKIMDAYLDRRYYDVRHTNNLLTRVAERGLA